MTPRKRKKREVNDLVSAMEVVRHGDGGGQDLEA